jgi:hypothetical protein
MQTPSVVTHTRGNIMGICKRITIFIFYEVTSRMVTVLKYIYSRLQVSTVLIQCIVSSLILSFKYSLFFPEISILMPYIVGNIPVYMIEKETRRIAVAT